VLTPGVVEAAVPGTGSTASASDAEAAGRGGEQQRGGHREAEGEAGEEVVGIGDQCAEDGDGDGTADLAEGVEHRAGGAGPVSGDAVEDDTGDDVLDRIDALVPPGVTINPADNSYGAAELTATARRR
jgi:hypothetical protein